MRKKALETILLLIGLAFLIPIPPSDPSPIRLFPAAAFGCVFFLGSRFLRHRDSGTWRALAVAGTETICFFAIAHTANDSANILLATFP